MPSCFRISPPGKPAGGGWYSRGSDTPKSNGFHVSQVEARRGNGEKAKARDTLAAIKKLKAVEEEKRPTTDEERQTLSRFGGFGPVALPILPDPVTGRHKDGWREIGEQLNGLLTPDEHDSA